MSKKIKFLSLLLSASMIVSSLCACAATETASSASSESSTSSEESSEEEEVVDTNMDGDVQLSEPGEFPIVIGDPVTLSIFTKYNKDTCTNLDAASNPATAYFEDITNVNFTWTVCSGADFTAKLNLLFQSNSYEDMIFGTGWDGATQYSYGTQGYIIPLNDYLETDSYYYQQYIDEKIAIGDNTQENWDSLIMPDGNIYSMANGGGGSHSDYSYRLWVYEPWLDTLGLDIPTTTDEFYDMLVAMRDGDPNGNGEADEIPLTGAPDGWNTDPFVFLCNSFIYYDVSNKAIINDGEVEMIYMQDEFKDALVYYNSLVEDNLMMTDVFSQDAVTMKAITTADTSERISGVVAGGAYNTFTLFTNGEYGEWLNWVTIAPLEGPDGVQNAMLSSVYPTAMLHITDNCEYPRVAFRVADAMKEEEIGCTLYMGVEGEYWRYTEEEELIGNTGEWANFRQMSFDGVDFCWGAITLAGTYPTWLYGMEGDAEVNQGYLLTSAAADYEVYSPDADIVLPPLIFDEDISKEVVDITTAIDVYFDESVASFAVYGGIEDGWDAYLERMNDLGVAELVEYYQEAYDRQYG